MSGTAQRRIAWAHSLIVWPIVFLCIVLPTLIYLPQIRAMLTVPPIELAEPVHAEMTPAGLWRVRTNVVLREACGLRLWRRAFRIEGEALDRPAIPEAWSMPAPPAAISEGFANTAGRLDAWVDYRPLAGAKGVLLVSVTNADCPSGYSDTVLLYQVPFDWS